MIPTYDWTQPEIVILVQRNHTPDEEVVMVSADGVTDTRVTCSFCGTSPWPCPVLLDLRAWWDENERKRIAMREERGRK